MADTKISALADGGALQTSDEFVVARSGTNVRIAGSAVSSSTTVTQTDETGATYTLALADAGTVVRLTNASNPTATIPPNSSVAFPVGALVNLYAAGATGATLAPGSGVTIHNNSPATIPQFGEISLRQDSADVWVRIG